MTIESYSEIVQKNRKKVFKPPYDTIYNHFEKEKFHLKDSNYFMANASSIVNKLRESWFEYQEIEKKFTSEMLGRLIDKEEIKNKTGFEAVTWFIESFPEEIYALTLSNTQSRRSRAGKEFEAIIELILIGAGIPMDSQGNIGKKVFTDKGLGKLVDIVSPGTIEYNINKRNTVLISAKTTLRERWQEVPEEMGRTGAREMFLATLDVSITSEVISALDESNIQVVTTADRKELFYAKYNSVLTFEDLLKILKKTSEEWENYVYTEKDKVAIKELLEKQLSKHQKHKFVTDYYRKLLKEM